MIKDDDKIYDINPNNGHKTTDEFCGVDSSDFINYGSIVSPEQDKAIEELYRKLPAPALKDEAWIQTYTGKKFFPLNPNIEDIDIEDIAHSLSMQCRFTGHSKFHYSVAQHSVLVSLNCEPQYALYGLLHDAAESYVCDLAAPLKKSGQFESYKKIETNLQSLIFTKYGLKPIEPDNIKNIDLRMLATEARDLMSPLHPEWKLSAQPFEFTIPIISPRTAKHYFLYRFYQLTNM